VQGRPVTAREEREFALARINRSLAYFDVLRRALDDVEVQAREVRAGIDSGRTVAESMAVVDGARFRRRATDVFGEFERLRHDARLGMILLAVSEGMTKAEVARTWGISPQWAGHEVSAARRLLEPPDRGPD
jgi:hypothetical protein